MWTRELGLRCGVTIPLYPVEHHYVVTEPLPGAFDELPVGRDPDLCIYFRGEGNAVMLGAFQAESRAWMVDRVPDNFSFQLLEPDWAKFAEPLKHGKHRIPALETCQFAKFVNGPESFTPDNNFILGEAPELRNLFVAAGFNSVGIASAGGAGKYLAEWMIEGQPTLDLWSVDIRRFGPWANNRSFLRERVTEVLGLHYQMAWPNREFTTGRGLRKSPLHDRLAGPRRLFWSKERLGTAELVRDKGNETGSSIFLWPPKLVCLSRRRTPGMPRARRALRSDRFFKICSQRPGRRERVAAPLR
jgi:4-methylaminobutanoate oxidase (formaldehyde-forming)